jgi:hypothetical protein
MHVTSKPCASPRVVVSALAQLGTGVGARAASRYGDTGSVAAVCVAVLARDRSRDADACARDRLSNDLARHGRRGRRSSIRFAGDTGAVTLVQRFGFIYESQRAPSHVGARRRRLPAGTHPQRLKRVFAIDIERRASR